MSRNYKNIFTGLFLVLPVAFLIGCGEDDAGVVIIEPETVEIKSGVFLDSAVEGINYVTETQSGKTTETGSFNYIEGETVTFSVGDIALPSALAKAVLTPLDLVGKSIDDPEVLNIAQFLQTLDVGSEPADGITIHESAHTLAEGLSFDFSAADFDTQADLINFIANAGGSTTLVIEATAKAHLALIEPVIEVFSFTRDFINSKTFSANLSLDVKAQEFYFTTDPSDSTVSNGTIKFSDEVREITSWQIQEDGSLKFIAPEDNQDIEWVLTASSITDGKEANFSYLQTEVVMDAGTGSMTLIENAFIPSFLLGTTDPTATVGSTFSVNHDSSILRDTQMSFALDGSDNGVGTFIDADGVLQDTKWSITLGVLTVTEDSTEASRFQWVFTATTNPADETNYSVTIKEGDFSASALGILTRL